MIKAVYSYNNLWQKTSVTVLTDLPFSSPTIPIEQQQWNRGDLHFDLLLVNTIDTGFSLVLVAHFA